jgi:capsid protein
VSVPFKLLLLGVVIFAVGATSTAFAEPVQQQRIPGIEQKPPEDAERARVEKEMAKQANQERQAVLKRDADNLLRLATELKQYVDKSNQNVLSVDVIKKAEQIEKLAHSVKEKMRGYN